MKSRSKGFSLIEVLVVLAVTTILTAIIAASLTAPRGRQSLDNARLGVLAALERARSLTLASRNESQYGVYFATTTVTVFTGTSYSAGASTNEVWTLPRGVEETVSLSGGGKSVVFIRLSGETLQSGTVALKMSNFATTTVRIYRTGIAE